VTATIIDGKAIAEQVRTECVRTEHEKV